MNTMIFVTLGVQGTGLAGGMTGSFRPFLENFEHWGLVFVIGCLVKFEPCSLAMLQTVSIVAT